MTREKITSILQYASSYKNSNIIPLYTVMSPTLLSRILDDPFLVAETTQVKC